MNIKLPEVRGVYLALGKFERRTYRFTQRYSLFTAAFSDVADKVIVIEVQYLLLEKKIPTLILHKELRSFSGYAQPQ